jgi:hypothetical protein
VPQLLSHFVVWIGLLAAGEKAVLAGKSIGRRRSLTASRPISDLELFVIGSNFDQFDHGFVAEDVADRTIFARSVSGK